MKDFLLKLFLLFFIGYNLCAQSLEENNRKFNNAKELFRLGNYSLAMEVFKQVASPRPENPYYQYASYYYILSASKANRLSEAALMAMQMEDKYSSWAKINEVRYLAADIAFKQRDYKEAFNYIKKLGRNFDQENIKSLSLNYLNKINSLDTLKKLNKDYPDNPYIGEILANKINMRPGSPQDIDILKGLIKEFKLDTAKFSSVLRIQSKKKSSYNVALLFPFLINELNPDNLNRSNYYAIDMYEGIKMGNEALSKHGIKLNLFTYDTGKDNQNLSAVLDKPELRSMDLLIGPMSNTPLAAFETYANAAAMLSVNPIANSSKIIEANPYAFLSDPTLEIQAKNSAQFILQNYSPKRVAIFYGATYKDSVLAANYRQAMVDKGVKISAYYKVTKGNVTLFTRVLSDSLNRVNNVFISSGEQSVAATFVSELEKNGYKIPVVALPQWLEYRFFNLDQFERLNFHFIYPDFIDYDKPSLKEFRESYKKSVNIIPSEFSYIGYDLINYFGNVLYKNGTNFQRSIGLTGYTPGVILPGYDFTQGNSNNYVPLVKFEDGKLKVINTPTK